jgi:AraC-like DNA-binding protein
MLAALRDAILHQTDRDPGQSPLATTVPGLTLLRSPREKPPGLLIYKPALCIVAQGSKWALFGDRHIEYGAGQALVVSVETPALGRVTAASLDEPYLGAIVEFDLTILRDVLSAVELPRHDDDDASGVFVADLERGVGDCVTRLIRLMDTPAAIPVLYPAIMRELSYWLLTGPQGGAIARLALAGDHQASIITAIHALRDRYAETVSVDDLADIARMSASAFHRQFKRMTSMTPLQYQKQLRLFEARRLMLAEGSNVESTAYRVGYESPSQFSREYARMFGAPPRRDVEQLRSGAA